VYHATKVRIIEGENKKSVTTNCDAKELDLIGY